MSSTSADYRVASDREHSSVCPLCSAEIGYGEMVAVCNSCGTVHHQSCWNSGAGCGAYSCIPARREELTLRPALAITRDDIAAAVPLPRRSHAAPQHGSPATQLHRALTPGTLRRSGWALAALITAVAGIPLFGLVTGLVAIVLAIIALVSIAGGERRGTTMAVCALTIGIADVVGWALILISYTGGGARQITQPVQFQTDLSALEGLDPALERAMRANVLIESRQLLGQAIGSGVILQIAGGEALIVTNRHVIDHSWAPGSSDEDIDADNVTVQLVDGSIEPAEVVWVAQGGVDLAIVSIPCTSNAVGAAPLAPGTQLNVGEPVFAIGNPHDLGWTHTQGTVSQFRIQGQGTSRVRVIQMQTALNPGNSGGGVYNREGKLVGISTWTADQRLSEGLNFAISAESLLDRIPPGLLQLQDLPAEEEP